MDQVIILELDGDFEGGIRVTLMILSKQKSELPSAIQA